MNRWLKILCIICLLSILSLACKVGLPGRDKGDEETSTPPAVTEEVVEVEPTPTRVPKATPTEEVMQPTTPPEAVEIRQWASSAKASSQYGDSDWSANQATGKPDTPEDCGDYTSAWASSSPYGEDWLEVYYDVPVVPTEITIIMNYNPSQVTEVEVIDLNGQRFLILVEDPDTYHCPDYMTITVEDVDFPIKGIRIILDQSILRLGWTEIDAVELVGITVGAASASPTQESSGSSGDDTGGFTPSGKVPKPSELKPGTYAMNISGYENDNFVNSEVQDQSTNNEIVAGIWNTTQRYVLSFFMPYDVKAGSYVFRKYDRKEATHFYGCFLFINAFSYPCDAGELVIDSIDGNKVTGTFWFTSTSSDFPDRSVMVEGSLNQVPLIKKK